MNRRTFGSSVVAWLASCFVFAATLGVSLPSGAPAQTTTLSVPGDIPANCSADATSALNAFFAGVPDGSVVNFPTGACYLVVGTVEVRGKTDVSIQGNGTRLVRTELSPQALRYPQRNAYLRIVDANRVTLSNVAVEGTNNGSDYGGSVADANGTARSVDCLSYLANWGCYTQALEFEHAYEVLGSVDTELSDVSAKDIWGDGVYVAGHDQFTAQQGQRVTLTNVSVDRNGRQGIAVNRIQHVLIDGFDLQRGRRSGVDIEPDYGTELISDIEIRNSTIETNLLAFASYGRGESSNVYIHDNTVTRTGVPWVYVRANDGTQRRNWRIYNNDVMYSLGSPQPGLLFDNVVGVDVQGNYNLYAAGQPTNAVGLFNGSTATVSCNFFENAAKPVVSDGTGTWTEDNNSTTTTPPSGCTGSSTPGPGETIPAAPSELQSNAFSDPRVDLSWTDNSDNEDAFELLRQGPGESSFNLLAYLGAGAHSYQDFDVVAGQQYCYQVVAHNGAGASAPSNTSCATPGSGPQPPAAPTNLLAAGTSTPEVDMTWTDNSSDESSFEVRRKGPQDADFWPIGNVPENVTGYTDTAVTGDQQYCYQVVASNANGNSEPSASSCATPPAPELPSLPAAPMQLQADSFLDGLVELSWIDAADNEDSFEIHRSVDGKNYRRLERLPANATTFEDQQLQGRRDRQYCYRVLAINSAGTAVSNEACIVAGS